MHLLPLHKKLADCQFRNKAGYLNMADNYVSLAFPMGESLSESDIEEVYNTGMDTGGLDFSGADLSGDQPYFIADLLSSNKMISIVHIDLSHTKTTVEGFEAILFAAMEIKTLESFVAKSLSLPKEAGMSLSKLIASKGCLKILDISQNDLGDVGLSNLSGAFSADHSKIMTKQLLSVVTLSVLDLSSNNLGDVGVLSLCRGLSQFVRRSAAVGVAPALKVLLLHNNNITDKAAICLAQLINYRDTNSLSASGALSPIPKSGLNNTLYLDELGLNGNPLTARGITALLGYASEGVVSPLKRLLLANTAVDVEVIELLGQNLLFNPNTTLNYVNLSVSPQQAAELVQGTANSGTNTGSANSYNYNAHRLYGALNQLCNAVVKCNSPSELRIQLGFLHRTLYTQAVYLTRSVHDSAEIVRTLDKLNHPTVAVVLGHAVVPNVEHWLRSAEYVYSESSAAYREAENIYNAQTQASANDASAVASNSMPSNNVYQRQNTINNYNSAPEGLPMFTPTKTHFAFTTDNTHITDNSGSYNNYIITKDDTQQSDFTNEAENREQYAPSVTPEHPNYAATSRGSASYQLSSAVPTTRPMQYEETEEYEIETALKQDARSLLSALRNLSPEGRAALAAPTESSGADSSTGNIDASYRTVVANLAPGGSADAPSNSHMVGIVEKAASFTAPVAPVAPAASISAPVPPSPALTAQAPDLTSPVRKSNFLSTFHGGVLGLLAGTEPVVPVAANLSLATTATSVVHVAVPSICSAATLAVISSPVVPAVHDEILPATHSISSRPEKTGASTTRIANTAEARVDNGANKLLAVNYEVSRPGTHNHQASQSIAPVNSDFNSLEYNDVDHNTENTIRSYNHSPKVVGESEFLKLRSDHTIAMRNLSQEIDRLAHISPSTKLLMQSPGAVNPVHSVAKDNTPFLPTTPVRDPSMPSSVVKTAVQDTPENDLYSVYQDSSSTPTFSMQVNPSFDSARVQRTRAENEDIAVASRTQDKISELPAATTTDAKYYEMPIHAGDSNTNNAAPIDDSLIQIIGKMQAKMNSMEASQALYESSFVNKFSSLEYRIECIEQKMQENGDVLKSIQDMQNQLLQRLSNGDAVVEEEKNTAVRDTEDTVPPSSETTPQPPSHPHPSTTTITATPSTQTHTHYSPLPPSIPNELVFTDLLARLEVVEDRLLSDRAAAMQSVLTKQLHQERQQELSMMLGGGSVNNSYAANLSTTNAGNTSMFGNNTFNASGHVGGMSPALSFTPQYFSSSATKLGTSPAVTPVRSPLATSALTPGQGGAVYSSAPAMPQTGSAQSLMYLPSGSQYSAVRHLSGSGSGSPLGTVLNTTAASSTHQMTPAQPYTPYTTVQPAPANHTTISMISASPYSVSAPTSHATGHLATSVAPMVATQFAVNPFVPKPAVYSSTEILQRPSYPQSQLEGQQQQQQQQYYQDTEYHQEQYHIPQAPSHATSNFSDAYDESLSQLAYNHNDRPDVHAQPRFEPAPPRTEYNSSYHYTNDNAEEQSQLTEPNDGLESEADESVRPYHDDDAMQTPYRDAQPSYQYNVNSGISIPTNGGSRHSMESALTEPTVNNQTSSNHYHTTSSAASIGDKYGLNDEHLSHINQPSAGGSFASSKTNEPLFEDFKRPPESNQRNTISSNTARPPIRPVGANNSSGSMVQKKMTVPRGAANKPVLRSNSDSTTAKTNSVPRPTSGSHNNDTVLLKHVANGTHAPPHPVSAHKAVASAYIDAGYYQYDFDALDAPLLSLDDRSVQSNTSNDSMRYAVSEPSPLPNHHDAAYNKALNTPEHNRLISSRDNNNPDNSMNYSIINNISRTSISMADDTLNDSVSLLDQHVHIRNNNVNQSNNQGSRSAGSFRNASSNIGTSVNATNLNNQGTSSSAAVKSRSKSPHFMRPTTSHAFKAASNRPVEAKVGVEYR